MKNNSVDRQYKQYKHRGRVSSPIYATEKNGAGPIFFLTIHTGNNQDRLMIEKCKKLTHARNHRKARQAQMKKMVRNEDTFTQYFRTAKGVRTRLFYFRFWGHSRLWPQIQKIASPDPFHVVRKVYTAKISCPPEPTFLWIRTHFFVV